MCCVWIHQGKRRELKGNVSSGRPDLLGLQEVQLMVLEKEKALASLGHPPCVLETFSLLEMCLTFWKKQLCPIYGPYLDAQTHTWSSYLQQTMGLGPGEVVGGVVGTQILDLALCPAR